MNISEKTITICGHGSGNPSYKNMYDYNQLRFTWHADNGKNKGVVKVMRLKNITDTGRAKFRQLYSSIIGRNVYNQNLRNYCYHPYKGVYYSDCSSSGCLTFRECGYDIPSLNTAGIYQDGYFSEVPVVIKNGHITNPEILKVGDAILYRGNDPKRPLQIGHVEWVFDIQGTVPQNTAQPIKSEYPKWVQAGMVWFYRLANGKNAHGWMEIAEKDNPSKKHWYFFDNKTGEMKKLCWIQTEKGWYYLNKDGVMAKSAWIQGKKGEWYYVTASGLMAIDAYVQDLKGRGFCYVDKNGVWNGQYINAVNSGNVVK